MNGGKKIGPASTAILFLNLAMAKYLMVLPHFMVSEVGNSAWIVIFLKGLAAIGLFLLIAALYKPYVGMGLGELTRRALTSPLGGALNFIIVCVMLVRGGMLFRILTEALQTLETDTVTIEYVGLFVLIPVLICALKGFNANVNASILILPFTVLSVVIISVALAPHYEVGNLMPIFGEGEGKILETAFLRFGGTFELMYLMTLSRSMGDYKTFKRGGLIGVGAISLFSFIFTLIYCLSVPYPVSKNFFFPLYQLTRMIKAGSFLQRMEPTVIFVWTGVIICGLSTLVIAAAELLKNTSGTKGGGGFVPLLVMIIFLVGVLPRSELDTYGIYKVVVNISHYFYIGVILAVLLTARLRKVERGLAYEA